ncbi:MAG: cation:proton antiporter [Candidatus Competibacteraceae bacterium]
MNPDFHHNVILFFLQIGVMLSVALAAGQAIRQWGQPAVLGELIGGILLGPTVFGMLFPEYSAWLFPGSSEVTHWREAMVRLGMLFFLFVAGLEINLAAVGERKWSALGASALGIFVPFTLGCGAVMLWPGFWGAKAANNQVVFALFLGTALSISALPVIARILMDLNLLRTGVGSVSMCAAAANDLIGWSVFAILLAMVQPNPSPHSVIVVLGTVAVFAATVLVLGRYGGRPLLGPAKRLLAWPSGFLGLTIVAILASASAAEIVGIHGIFGAFLLGVALGRGPHTEDVSQAHDIIHQFSISIFVPLYCVSVGLKANFATSFDPLLVGLVLGIASIGKLLGGGLGARAGGMPWRQAWTVGFILNARGAMEIILATLALETGLIDERVFVALVVMALVTSMLSGPVVQRLVQGSGKTVPSILQSDELHGGRDEHSPFKSSTR